MHARYAFVPSPDKLSANMNCFLRVSHSLRDLRLEEFSICTESQRLVEAIKNPSCWPRYRYLLRQIAAVSFEFEVVTFDSESRGPNKVAR